MTDSSHNPRRFACIVRRHGHVAAILTAISLPLLAGDFLVFQVTQLMVYAIAIMGLNVLVGINGQLSLGHGAFYALGAYTVAILMDGYGMPYGWTLLVAAAITFAAGFAFGLPALRLEGIYLALATFTLAIALPQILKLSVLNPWTGGVQGISIAKPEAPSFLPINADQWLYALTLLMACLIYWLARNLIGSRTGRALAAVKDNALAARTMGINVALYKTLAFSVSACFTGIAGALSAIVVQYVSPDSFTFYLSVAILVGLVVGGVGWLPGAFLGAAFILFVPNIAEGVSKGLSGAVYGILLIALIVMRPSSSAAGGGTWRSLLSCTGRRAHQISHPQEKRRQA
ncbi:branched-chain amino acid ABC transporter permease [Variovorax sp. tm]|uniref:branched-chain amino acid ABC transporter permease n=1 Tax=Variovorax atrisoli TaxID=3394203 RepID=UPI003A80B058